MEAVKKTIRTLFVTLFAMFSAALLLQAVYAAAPGTEDSPVLFGKASLGKKSPVVRPNCADDPKVNPGKPDCFDPDHDSSATALDQIVPHVVTSIVLEDVYFERGGGNHGVAVYAPGTDVEALQAAAAVAPPGPPSHFNIDTSEFDRLFAGPQGTGWTLTIVPGGTFSEPGRYLVVCTFRPHFVDLDMYGYVEVK